MTNLLRFIFLIFIVFLCIISCERAATDVEGQLQEITLSKLDGIPSEYGSLMGITTHAQYPDWAQLWFEDGNKTIRVVRVGTMSNRVHEKVTVIPRN